MKKRMILSAVFLSVCLFMIGVYYFGCFTKNYKILACISSFNRPVFVSGQVLRMLQQSYPVDISVSVKGVPENFIDESLKKEWAPEIASGRVKMRVDANRDLFSNFLDTVRDVDLSQYDYFCKIDDNDWYAPDYFKHVREWLKKENNTALSYTQNSMMMSSGDNFVGVSKSPAEPSGSSLCFSRQVIETALQLEQNPDAAETYIAGYPLSEYREKNEDFYLQKLAQQIGTVQNRETSVWDLVFGLQYRSVFQ